MQILFRSYHAAWYRGAHAIRKLTEPPMPVEEAKAFIENLPRVLEVTNQKVARWPLLASQILDENGVNGEILPESPLVALARLNVAQAAADAATCRERFIRFLEFLPDGTTAAQIIALLA